MWEFDEDGELMYEKWYCTTHHSVHGFLPELFQRWKSMGTNHVVSIVMFARVLYPQDENADVEKVKPRMSFDGSNGMSRNGGSHRDFYRVIVDWETNSDWTQILGVNCRSSKLN